MVLFKNKAFLREILPPGRIIPYTVNYPSISSNMDDLREYTEQLAIESLEIEESFEQYKSNMYRIAAGRFMSKLRDYHTPDEDTTIGSPNNKLSMIDHVDVITDQNTLHEFANRYPLCIYKFWFLEFLPFLYNWANRSNTRQRWVSVNAKNLSDVAKVGWALFGDGEPNISLLNTQPHFSVSLRSDPLGPTETEQDKHLSKLIYNLLTGKKYIQSPGFLNSDLYYSRNGAELQGSDLFRNYVFKYRTFAEYAADEKKLHDYRGRQVYQVFGKFKDRFMAQWQTYLDDPLNAKKNLDENSPYFDIFYTMGEYIKNGTYIQSALAYVYLRLNRLYYQYAPVAEFNQNEPPSVVHSSYPTKLNFWGIKDGKDYFRDSSISHIWDNPLHEDYKNDTTPRDRIIIEGDNTHSTTYDEIRNKYKKLLPDKKKNIAWSNVDNFEKFLIKLQFCAYMITEMYALMLGHGSQKQKVPINDYERFDKAVNDIQKAPIWNYVGNDFRDAVIDMLRLPLLGRKVILEKGDLSVEYPSPSASFHTLNDSKQPVSSIKTKPDVKINRPGEVMQHDGYTTTTHVLDEYNRNYLLHAQGGKFKDLTEEDVARYGTREEIKRLNNEPDSSQGFTHNQLSETQWNWWRPPVGYLRGDDARRYEIYEKIEKRKQDAEAASASEVYARMQRYKDPTITKEDTQKYLTPLEYHDLWLSLDRGYIDSLLDKVQTAKKNSNVPVPPETDDETDTDDETMSEDSFPVNPHRPDSPIIHDSDSDDSDNGVISNDDIFTEHDKDGNPMDPLGIFTGQGQGALTPSSQMTDRQKAIKIADNYAKSLNPLLSITDNDDPFAINQLVAAFASLKQYGGGDVNQLTKMVISVIPYENGIKFSDPSIRGNDAAGYQAAWNFKQAANNVLTTKYENPPPPGTTPTGGGTPGTPTEDPKITSLKKYLKDNGYDYDDISKYLSKQELNHMINGDNAARAHYLQVALDHKNGKKPSPGKTGGTTPDGGNGAGIALAVVGVAAVGIILFALK